MPAAARDRAATAPRGALTRAHAAAAGLAAAGAALLVYQWAGALPFWLDEEMLALNLRGRSVTELAGPLWLAQSAPFGWLSIQRLVLVVAGDGERALRLLPLLFGLGTLATAVWIGIRWLGPAGGAVLVLLCAFSPWLSYHAVELKPYSADAFWGLLLPALGAWALEETGEGGARRDVRRVAAWWAVAAVALWLGTGALLAAPACAIVLHAVLWRRHGWRASAAAAVPAVVFAVSAGLHYAVNLRHAAGHQFLQTYWNFALPPENAGFLDTARWLASRLRHLAVKPLGTSHSVMLWTLATAGVGVAARARPLCGLLLASVPLSAFAWAGFRLVPMFERLSLWIVPSVYVAVAVAAAAIAWLARRAVARRRLAALGLALAGAAPIAVVAADVVWQGGVALTARPGNNNHDLDDRGGVTWLVAQAQPGDAVLTTHLALPAVWWYGNIAVPGKAGDGAREAQGGHPGQRDLPVFEAQPASTRPRCDPPLADQLGRPRRALVYFGFRFDDWPRGYDDVLFARLAEAGEVTAYRTFAVAGAAMVVDFRRPPPGPTPPLRPGAKLEAWPPAGCVTAVPARSW